MKKLVEILAYAPEREYTRIDGQKGYGRSVVVQWMDEGANGRYEQSTVVEVNGRMDEDMLASAKENRTLTDITVYFSHTEFNGKYYPRIRAYFPQGYMMGDNKK